jgi:hypothetical protein
VSWLTYPAALCAAAAFAVAIPLEHRSADRAPEAGGLEGGRLRAFITATVTDRWWLGGMALNTVGLLLHALALHAGALAVVQPLLLCNLLFALPVHHRLRREAVRGIEVLWAALLVTGLTGFLLVATAGVPTGSEPADRGPAVAAGILVGLAAAALVLSARRAGGTAAAALLGVATGALFAVTASLLKVCTGLLARGPLHLVGSWQLYVLVIAGAAGILLNQLAYQAGPLSASLPAITVVDPLIAVLIGVVVFDEHLRHTPAAVVGEVLFLALLAVAGVALSRLERGSQTRPSVSVQQ